MRVAIAGAGKVGRSVARELVDYGHKILLIERERSNFEPQSVPGADWFNADACELDTLEEAGIETCDVVVAATGDDKANLVVGLLAKSEFGVPRVVARINDIRNQWLFGQAWGGRCRGIHPRRHGRRHRGRY
ncbi:Putative potassium uptake protein [Mycobacteroides abscessus subsp. massiliense]|nr:Putative potassium uptake protein [Mycobacteroides abscessus subsp. massiliense]